MDIDIDFADRNKILELVKHIPASMLVNEEYKKHNSGVYFQNIPVNPITKAASIDYKTAEDRGYFKIDFLNVSIYRDVKNEKHLDELINREPLWELLQHQEFSDNVFHLNGHSLLLQTMKPTNIDQLAMIIAMIRPAKRHLIGKSWEQIEREIWQKPTNNDYYYKQSHAFSYAMAVIVHMNLICENLTSLSSSN
jgi:hypothetical protein